MTKSELIQKVAVETGTCPDQATVIVERFLKAIALELKESRSMSLYGFGTFSVKQLGVREGFNPNTKEKITVPPTKRISFKAGNELRRVVDA